MEKSKQTVFFSTRDELTKVCLDDVMYAASDGNYITLRFKSGRTLTILASLQNFIQVTETIDKLHFARIGRSYVINTNYLSQVNSLRKSIILVDDDLNKTTELIVSKEAIKALRQEIAELPHEAIPNFHTSNGNMEAFQLVGS